MRTAVVCVLFAVGIFFTVSGGLGLVRMPDLYCRIQCASKTVTMGALPVLIGITVAQGPVTQYGSRALLVAVLLVVVNPAASHAIARAAYKMGVPMWRGSVADDPHADDPHADDTHAADRSEGRRR